VAVVLSNGTEEGTVQFNTELAKAEPVRNQPVQSDGQQAQQSPGRQQSSNVQQPAQRGSQSRDGSHHYPLPPGMNQYNQRHYGDYIRQHQELKKQQQKWQQMQRSVQQQ
jgi:hypothetical protein